MVIAENCKYVREVPVDKVEEILGDEYHNALLDTRHNIVSIHNSMKLDMYFNYLETIKRISQETKSGRFYYMLDLGFMPVSMLPFGMPREVQDLIAKALEKHEIPYKKLPGSSLTKTVFQSDYPDIWVSKLDCTKVLNCRPIDVRVRNLLEAIL